MSSVSTVYTVSDPDSGVKLVVVHEWGKKAVSIKMTDEARESEVEMTMGIDDWRALSRT